MVQFEARNGVTFAEFQSSPSTGGYGMGWEENSLNVANENPLLVVSVAPGLLSVRQSVDGLGGRSFDVFERAMRGLLK